MQKDAHGSRVNHKPHQLGSAEGVIKDLYVIKRAAEKGDC